MVLETDGYLALIEHLSLNLDIFTTEIGDTGSESIEDVVTDMVASNIMAIFEQNPELHSSVRFKLLKEADAVVEDLGEILAGVWHNKATNEQITFLDEYIALVKNLFDNAVASYDWYCFNLLQCPVKSKKSYIVTLLICQNLDAQYGLSILEIITPLDVDACMNCLLPK